MDGVNTGLVILIVAVVGVIFLAMRSSSRATGSRTAASLAEYLASHAATLSVETLQHRVIAIHRAHLDAGQP